MKAISAIIVVVLLLLISISLISVVYVWSSALTGTVTSTTEETTSELTKQLSSCLKIDAISGNEIYLRNCGKGVITNNSLSVFIDDVKVEHSVEEIGEDQTGTVNISGLWQFSMDRHNLKLTNGAAFVQALIELEPNKDGLVGYWSFDEGSGNKIYDKSGNGNDGTLLPSGSGPIWTAGKFGNALSFDGTDDYVNIPYSSSLEPLNSITLEAWVNPLSPETHLMVIRTGYGLAIGGENQILFTPNGADWYNASVTVTKGIWYHIVGIYDNTTQWLTKIYVNGQLSNGYRCCGATCSEWDGSSWGIPCNYNIGGVSANGVGIGAFPTGGYYFNGTIDEVRIWNKALTPDQTVVMKMV